MSNVKLYSLVTYCLCSTLGKSRFLKRAAQVKDACLPLQSWRRVWHGLCQKCIWNPFSLIERMQPDSCKRGFLYVCLFVFFFFCITWGLLLALILYCWKGLILGYIYLYFEKSMCEVYFCHFFLSIFDYHIILSQYLTL